VVGCSSEVSVLEIAMLVMVEVLDKIEETAAEDEEVT
jgi:hypothetical protein